jgi:hypothetical protein
MILPSNLGEDAIFWTAARVLKVGATSTREVVTDFSPIGDLLAPVTTMRRTRAFKSTEVLDTPVGTLASQGIDMKPQQRVRSFPSRL